MKNILLVWMLCVALLGCMQDDPEIGSDFFDDVSFEIVTWDTLTVEMSTVLIDSIRTSNPARLLVGQAKHTELDLVEAESYFQLRPTLDFSDDELENTKFQSAFLTLHYDRYYCGDTTEFVDLHLYELAEPIELDDESMLYNNSSFEVVGDSDGMPIAIGTFTYSPRPNAQDSIEIPLGDEFARKLFDYLKSDAYEWEDFDEFLPGLKINTSQVGAIIGFKTTPVLRIEYLDQSESPAVERSLSIESGTGEIRFNHLASANLEDMFMDETAELSTELTDQKALIQSGLGLALKVELPYLQNILSADEAPVFDEVNLELVFENEIPEEAHMLASGLTLSRIDHHNDILFEYEESSELMLDIEYGEDRKFVLDITDFVEEQLDIDMPDNEHALLIQFPQEYFLGTVNHLIVSDQNRHTESSKIILNVLNIK